MPLMVIGQDGVDYLGRSVDRGGYLYVDIAHGVIFEVLVP